MVLSSSQEELVTHKMVVLIHHETATLHPDGAHAAQVRGDVTAVTHALIIAALEVPLLIEDNLPGEQGVFPYFLICMDSYSIDIVPTRNYFD